MTLNEEQLESLLEGCKHGARGSQKALYDSFCAYAFAICMRYTHREEEASDIVNDGFLKVFMHISKFTHSSHLALLPAFKGWLKKIMVFTAIDHYRAQLKHNHQDIEKYGSNVTYHGEDAVAALSHKELMLMVQALSPAYRMVFNLFVIDGFSHEEIAGKLGISVGTSKSNLAKARENLRKMIYKLDEKIYVK